ncbi:hypothetical protein LAZ40_03140 [Cereibacter sphaeroides]|uniref:hypothetical protein n=1 Tax=Cereibacter sphaeroides TaxID=1063 RepID=UPI001F3BFE2E|nr:hypothetical protein [Cereibacter sphaeroides]MCE6958050.1 hypothetical protein [Cereibacter sphaeroides]MCE6971357.1 hypothetical protein [Cereibacter sphaeroides]
MAKVIFCARRETMRTLRNSYPEGSKPFLFSMETDRDSAKAALGEGRDAIVLAPVAVRTWSPPANAEIRFASDMIGPIHSRLRALCQVRQAPPEPTFGVPPEVAAAALKKPARPKAVAVTWTTDLHSLFA